MLSDTFSKASSVYDEKIRQNFINRYIRDREVSTLLKYYKNGKKVLEIGCGTGEECRRFIQSTGASVVGLDISHGMIEFATQKMAKSGLEGKFAGICSPASQCKILNEKFGTIYSFNGAMNTEPDIQGFIESLCSLTETGSVLVLSLRNRRCFGELIVYGILGNTFRKRYRKEDLVDVEVVGVKIPSRYFSSKEVLHLFSDFRSLRIIGLGVVLPPSLASRVNSRLARKIVTSLEILFSSLPFLKKMGDETLYVLERK